MDGIYLPLDGQLGMSQRSLVIAKPMGMSQKGFVTPELVGVMMA